MWAVLEFSVRFDGRSNLQHFQKDIDLELHNLYFVYIKGFVEKHF